MSLETSAERDAVIWCAACGIPYAAGTPYCTSCRQSLDTVVAGGSPVAAAPYTGNDDDINPVSMLAEPTAQAEVFLGAGDAVRQPVRPRGALGRRIARRPPPLTEGQIEALAAAIVAQAQAEELSEAEVAPPTPAPVDPGLEAEPLTYLEFLPPLRDRDRQWLVAGFICCVVLILFTIIFVRYLAA